MTNVQVGLIVVGAMTAVFGLAALLLGALERTPGLRETAVIPRSPSRALAVPVLIGGLALIGSSLVFPRPTLHRTATLVMVVGGGTGLLVHALSAFVRGERARHRMGELGYGLLLLAMVLGAFFWDRR